MKLNFDKSGLTLVFISITGLLFHTAGFDFYHHSLSYTLKAPINWGYFLSEKLFLPRYLLLSNIYELFALTSIPLGWIISSLIIIPTYQIGKNHFYKNLKSEKIFAQFLIFYFSFQFSANNLGILWIIAFFLTNHYFFLIGILFHPVALSLIIPITVISLIKREKKPIITCFVFFIIFIIISIIKSNLGIPYDISEYPVRAIITPKIFWTLAQLTLTNSKSKLINIIVICLFAFILSIKKIRLIFLNLVNSYFLKRIFFFPVFWSFFLSFLLIITIGKKTLINNIFSYKEFPLTMEITWISKKNMSHFDYYDRILKKRQNTTY